MQLIQDYLEDVRVIRELREIDNKGIRLITAVGLAREPPFDGWNLPVRGLHWFNMKQIYRAARKMDPLGDSHHPLGLPPYERAHQYLIKLSNEIPDPHVKILPRQDKVAQPFAATESGYKFALDRLDRIMDYLDRRTEVNADMKEKSTAKYTTMVPEEALGGFTAIYLERRRALTIGRLEDNDFPFITDEAMSRRHARVTFRGEKFWIDDLQSTNGTWKIDAKGSKERRRVQYEEVADGDDFQLGNTRIRFLSKHSTLST